MGNPSVARVPGRMESWLALAVFVGCVACHFGAAMIGWQSKNLPGVEFRQAQTALSAQFIKQENNFSLAYPTPVLGKPWSIPLEFPLYQWTVVVVGRLTGLGLTKSGRVVSMACFYLMLPAVYLLLARWRVAPGHRWLVLAVVVTCPLYIFYSRAFLVETMALMFSVWFWVAFERAVAERSLGWLTVATVAGAGAGLVKVTTLFLYLLPVAGWAVIRLWRLRRGGRWRRELAWMAAAVAGPLGATVWWLKFSDGVRALNPSAQFLRSDGVENFVLGTTATRFSGELWAMKGQIIADQLSWLPLLVGFGVIALLGARRRWREIGLCLAVFAVALVIFPELYAYHDYYYLANTVLLMAALGLVVVALAESSRIRWLPLLAVIAVAGGQLYGYFVHYYPAQRGISYGGDGLSRSLRLLTQPDEVIVIVGQDWNSMTPYYADRRALMITVTAEDHPQQIEAALAALEGEKIGALVVDGPLEKRGWLIQRLAARGLEPKPVYFARNAAVFLPKDRLEADALEIDEGTLFDVRFAPGIEPHYSQPANAWFDVAKLPPAQRRNFRGMNPVPVRFFSRFGLTLELSNGRMDFGAHPVTRLVFALPAGKHALHTSVIFAPDAYDARLKDDETTDGVEITLAALGPHEERRVLGTRLIDPRHHVADRGRKPVRMEFTLPQAGEVELFVGPGPQGRDTRDWVKIGRVLID
ncbi:MAG: hypothetical protein ABI222_04635 [Opitutaceae bacterium]